MPTKIIFLLTFLLANNTFIAYSQVKEWHVTGQISGMDQQALPAPTVMLVNKNGKEVLKTSAGNEGRFHIQYNVKDSFRIIVTHAGYTEYKSSLFELNDKDFGLLKLITANTMTEVVVNSKQSLVELEGNRIVYNVAKSINAQGVSALEALKKHPAFT